MPDSHSQRVKIEGTDDFDVARALAYLAGFEGCVVTARYPGYHEGTGREVIVFHKETMAKDPDLYPATQAPDIMVSQFLGDEYLVEFNERVDPSLISGIETEIQRAYSEIQRTG